MFFSLISIPSPSTLESVNVNHPVGVCLGGPKPKKDTRWAQQTPTQATRVLDARARHFAATDMAHCFMDRLARGAAVSRLRVLYLSLIHI